MHLLQDPPPGFEEVTKAYAMARLLPSTHHLDLRVGLACKGALIASDRLDGHRQIAFFSDHLRRLGWHEHLLGGDVDMHGCDLLFSHPDDHAQEHVEDPSFIRRSPMELWGSHAAEQ